MFSQLGFTSRSFIALPALPCSQQAVDEEEQRLMDMYPAPTASRFILTSGLLDGALTAENYRQRMHELLYIEEMAQYSSIAK
jgi:hypothetical protein